jgi:hypothetical protein
MTSNASRYHPGRPANDSSRVPAGTHECDCPSRPNDRPHAGHVHAMRYGRYSTPFAEVGAGFFGSAVPMKGRNDE